MTLSQSDRMRVPHLILILAALPLAWQQDEQKQSPPPPKALVVDQAVPSFRLNDHTGKAVNVGKKADQWTVLAFYPKALTPG